MTQDRNLLSKAFARLWGIRLVRFGAGGSCNLTLKMALAYTFLVLSMPLWLNYALVQVATLFFAYGYHSRITFGLPMSAQGFGKFTLSILVLRIIDYVFVLSANYVSVFGTQVASIPRVGAFLAEHLLFVTIALATVLIFFLRYAIFKKYTFQERTSQVMTNNPGLAPRGGP